MTQSASKKANVAVFLATLAISATTMVWLFWRFPLTTALFTIGILGLLGVSARLAGSIEPVDISEVERGEVTL